MRFFALGILRRGAGEQSFRIEVGLPAQLVDAFGHFAGVLAFFLGMLGEFGLYAFARNPGGRDRMHRIAQDADDLRGQNRLQDLDGPAASPT